MELLCHEQLEPDLNDNLSKDLKQQQQYSMFVEPHRDANLAEDGRVLENLLAYDQRPVDFDYFATVQTEIRPHMRKVVADWMFEVVEDRRLSLEVFFLALNYMDRFLARVDIRKSQFQLVASVCLLLASKLADPMPLSCRQLSHYTDGSVTVDELVQWEILVVDRLNWELFALSPGTVAEHLLLRRAGGRRLQRDTLALLAQAATQFEFAAERPTVLAMAAVSLMCQLEGVEEEEGKKLEEEDEEEVRRVMGRLEKRCLLPAEHCSVVTCQPVACQPVTCQQADRLAAVESQPVIQV